MPKEARNANFGAKFQARPTRGSKLFRSLLARGPELWTIAPIILVSGSFTVGSNSEFWPYFVENGVSYAYRSPRFKVRFFSTFQSSCRWAWCPVHCGSQLA